MTDELPLGGIPDRFVVDSIARIAKELNKAMDDARRSHEIETRVLVTEDQHEWPSIHLQFFRRVQTADEVGHWRTAREAKV